MSTYYGAVARDSQPDHGMEQAPENVGDDDHDGMAPLGSDEMRRDVLMSVLRKLQRRVAVDQVRALAWHMCTQNATAVAVSVRAKAHR